MVHKRWIVLVFVHIPWELFVCTKYRQMNMSYYDENKLFAHPNGMLFQFTLQLPKKLKCDTKWTHANRWREFQNLSHRKHVEMHLHAHQKVKFESEPLFTKIIDGENLPKNINLVNHIWMGRRRLEDIRPSNITQESYLIAYQHIIMGYFVDVNLGTCLCEYPIYFIMHIVVQI